MTTPKITVDTSNKIVEDTTEQQLADMASRVKEAGRAVFDDNVPYGSDEDSSNDDTSDDDYIPPVNNRCTDRSNVLSASDRIYMDNQNLWKKMTKASATSERLEERIRYLQLDMNNKIVECDKHVKNVTRLKELCKEHQTIIRSNSATLQKMAVFCSVSAAANIVLLVYSATGINLILLAFSMVHQST